MKIKKTITIKSISVGIICILLCSMMLTTVASGEHINKLQQSQTSEYEEPIPSETVDIKIQLSGSTDNEEVSVTITKEQAAQFGQRIQLFKEQLEQSQTDKQTTQVFIDMIHYLDAQNMLPSHLSVQQAIQQVLAFNHQNKRMGSLLQRINSHTIMNVETDNSFCLVAGKSTNTHVRPYSLYPFNYAYYLTHTGHFSPVLLLPLAIIIAILVLKPLTIASDIGYGIPWTPYSVSSTVSTQRPATGWLFTAGLQGIKSWNGSFYGGFNEALVGTFGFCGIKIYIVDFKTLDYSCFYFGSAVAVKIQ